MSTREDENKKAEKMQIVYATKHLILEGDLLRYALAHVIINSCKMQLCKVKVHDIIKMYKYVAVKKTLLGDKIKI